MTALNRSQIEQLAQDIFDAYLSGPDNPQRVEDVEKIIAKSLEKMDHEMMADKDDDKRRWNDDHADAGRVISALLTSMCPTKGRAGERYF